MYEAVSQLEIEKTTSIENLDINDAYYEEIQYTGYQPKRGVSKKLVFCSGVVITILILSLTVAFVSWQAFQAHHRRQNISIFELHDGVYEYGAVSCDAPICARIGRNMLVRGGGVVDAAIATLLCMGVVHSQSMGIGGGFMGVYYNASVQRTSIGRVLVMNARETAPIRATRDMFHGNPEKSMVGGLAVAVPGEIKGYWALHQRAGKLPWKDLFQPTIEICQNGFNVTRHTAMALRNREHLIMQQPTIMEILVNPETGKIYQENDTITRRDLVDTLQRIAEGGEHEFYYGEVGKRFVEDLQELGGIITMRDLDNYTAEWQTPVQVKVLGGFTLHTTPPPGSGVLVAFIMKLLGKYELDIDAFHQKNDAENITTYHRIIEAFKHAFAKRTGLGDPLLERDQDAVYGMMAKLISDEYVDEVFEKIKLDSTNTSLQYYGANFYQPDDHGTSHVSIVGANGDAIAITSTINLYWGALIRSRRTGIIYNNEMDDFSAPNITNYFGVPPSPQNFIEPVRRPVSSMAPSIFTDFQGRVRLVIGAAGGTKITTATALVSMRNLWFGENIKEAVEARRLHHQLLPMVVQYERDFSPVIIDGLKAIGHNVTEVAVGQSVVVAIARNECTGKFEATSDFRKPGTVAGF